VILATDSRQGSELRRGGWLGQLCGARWTRRYHAWRRPACALYGQPSADRLLQAAVRSPLMEARPRYLGLFQPTLQDQFVGTFPAATFHRVAPHVKPRLVEHGLAFLQISQTLPHRDHRPRYPAPLGFGRLPLQGAHHCLKLPLFQPLSLRGEPRGEGGRPFPIHHLPGLG
jgi:hypothetical protein